MGLSMNKCKNCCKSNENNELKFDNNENGGTSSENKHGIKKEESIRDLKSYITFKNIQTNSIGEDFSSNNNVDNGITSHLKVQKKILKSNNSKIIDYESHKNLIIKIQSFYRGYQYRKNIFPLEKITLEEETMNKLKDLYNLYHTPNLMNMENQLGIKFNEESYKSLITNTLPIKNYISKKEKENHLYTKLLILKYEDIDSFYVGEVNINNELNGRGILINKQGCKLDGTFENNRFTGNGKYIDEEGNYYEGYFKNKKLEGKGIKRTIKGIIYNGDFIDGIKDGKGKEETLENVYEGEFKNNKKNGKGKLYYKILKDTYEGDFKDNNITGKGFYEWSNKETYKGTFLNGKMHGKGIYKWPDGGKYEGDYFNNIKEGNGVFTWSNGKIFDGPFKNGKPHGHGILIMQKKKFKVFFNNGKLDGKAQEIDYDSDKNYDKNDDKNEENESEEESEKKSDNSSNMKSESSRDIDSKKEQYDSIHKSEDSSIKKKYSLKKNKK
jgi:hypothetical protein